MEKVEAVEANLQETERVQWQRRPKTLCPWQDILPIQMESDEFWRQDQLVLDIAIKTDQRGIGGWEAVGPVIYLQVYW